MPASHQDATGAALLSRVMYWWNGTNAVPANATTPLPATLANAAGTPISFDGSTNEYLLDASLNTVNAATVKALPGHILQVEYKNAAAYDIFIKIYTPAGLPVPGTDAMRARIRLPASSGGIIDLPPIQCTIGIGIGLTKLIGTADTTVILANDITSFALRYA